MEHPPAPSSQRQPAAGAAGTNAEKKLQQQSQATATLSPADESITTFAVHGDRPTSSQQHNRQPVVDPLSELIYLRANAQDPAGKQQHIRRLSDNPLPAVTPASVVTPNDKVDAPSADALPNKDKKKGVKFLSRFMLSKRKDLLEESSDALDEDKEDRPEGADAELFYQPPEHVAFNPKYPQPPGYIKVRARYKKAREFHRVFLAQELDDRNTLARSASIASESKKLRKERNLTVEDDAIWAMSFSEDGRYVATAGQDKKVRVWSVIHSREERRQHEKEEEADNESEAVHLSAPVFRNKPKRTYEGHTGPILDLCWSKNNFLLSSSMDKTVRLWHVSRPECLCAFKHSDFVTSIRFHPKDDRFFLAGSLDSKLRLWSIPDKSVAYWNHVPDMITAVGFTPDGKTAIAGCLTGLLHFYDTEGLKYATHIHVRSAHGKNAKGSKITGIDSAHMPEGGPVKLLITSNDSRIRLFNFRDKSLEMKFKGLENFSSQIHARFSDDARHVICGSEDNRVYIWSTNAVDLERKNKWPVEVFEAHSATTTCAALAPARTRQLLSTSEDPLYDLCNPPPVHLVSRFEETSSQTSATASKQADNMSDDASSIQPTPAGVEGNGSFPRPSETPGYISRSLHAECGGAIIVTADATGAIKVFRQDCAYEKRRAAAGDWDSSSMIGRKFGSSTSSIIRRASQATHHSSVSRTDSFSSLSHAGAPGGGRERINSWRQSVGSTTSQQTLARHSSASSFRNGTREQRAAAATQRSERSSSPRKSLSLIRGFATNGSGTSSVKASPIMSPLDSSSPALSKGSHSQHVNGANNNTSRRSPRAAPNTASLPNLTREVSNGVPLDEEPAAPQRPSDLPRQDTDTYWQQDAWRDAMIDQLSSHHGQHAAPKKPTSTSAAKAKASKAKAHQVNDHLAVAPSAARRLRLAPGSSSPSVGGSTDGDAEASDASDASLSRRLSTVSALTDNSAQ